MCVCTQCKMQYVLFVTSNVEYTIGKKAIGLGSPLPQLPMTCDRLSVTQGHSSWLPVQHTCT